MSNVHDGCRHVPLGYGAVYCPRVRLAYVRVDQVPTPNRFKKRPDDVRMLGIKFQEINNALRGIPFYGIAVLKPTMSLPRTPQDYPDLTDFLRELALARKAEQENPAPKEKDE